MISSARAKSRMACALICVVAASPPATRTLITPSCRVNIGM